MTISLGSAATGTGAITAATIENLTIAGATAVTSAGALGTLALGAVALTNGAGAQKLVITNSGNLTAGIITADTVDTTGVTGTVVLTGTMLNSSGTAFTGGSGNTTLAGSAASDSIVTGIGVDTINTSTGDDFISTGAGNDVINLGAGANVVDAGAENDNIISVTDIALLSVINGGTGTDTLILTGGGTANDILTVSPLNLIENIVFMTGASPNPAFAGAALTGKSIVLSEIVATASATVTYVIAAGDVINLSGITTAVGTAGQGGAATTAITGVTTVTVGAGATVTGPAAIAATYNGTTGAEKITGGSGVDTITGGTGADTMNGGAGNDSFLQTGATDTGFVAAAASISTATLDKITANTGDTITLFLQTAGGYDTLGTLATATSITNTVVANTGINGTVARSQGVFDATAQTFTIGATGANAVLISYSTTNAGTTADQQIVITGVTNVTSILDGVITV